VEVQPIYAEVIVIFGPALQHVAHPTIISASLDACLAVAPIRPSPAIADHRLESFRSGATSDRPPDPCCGAIERLEDVVAGGVQRAAR